MEIGAAGETESGSKYSAGGSPGSGSVYTYICGMGGIDTDIGSNLEATALVVAGAADNFVWTVGAEYLEV